MAQWTADGTVVGLQWDRLKAQAGAGAQIGHEHAVVAVARARLVQVEAVGVLHQKLAPAHHAEAGTYLVAELPLDVVERARPVAIASGGIAEDRGDHFLCRRAVQHLPLVAVLEPEPFKALGALAPAFRTRTEDRKGARDGKVGCVK